MSTVQTSAGLAGASPRRLEGSAATTPGDGQAAAPADHPGRWVGGAIGAVVSLAAALVASRIAPGDGSTGALSLDWTAVGLLGAPIGFALGRQLFPMARSEGWRRALSVGLLLGWVAPPLGAIEILATAGLFDSSVSPPTFQGPLALVLLPIAIPISFIAIFMTLPVGLIWSVLARLAPGEALLQLRAPGWLAWLGIRHALVLLAVELLVLTVIRPDLF
jgi:hypothetical protein